MPFVRKGLLMGFRGARRRGPFGRGHPRRGMIEMLGEGAKEARALEIESLGFNAQGDDRGVLHEATRVQDASLLVATPPPHEQPIVHRASKLECHRRDACWVALAFLGRAPGRVSRPAHQARSASHVGRLLVVNSPTTNDSTKDASTPLSTT